MGQAAHSAAISIATTLGGSYTEIDGLSQASYDVLNDLVDDTAIKDSGASRTNLFALQGLEFDLSGVSERSDTNGWGALNNAAFAQTEIFLKVLPNGTTGYKGAIHISNFREEMAVGDAVKWSCKATRSGASTAV